MIDSLGANGPITCFKCITLRGWELSESLVQALLFNFSMRGGQTLARHEVAFSGRRSFEIENVSQWDSLRLVLSDLGYVELK